MADQHFAAAILRREAHHGARAAPRRPHHLRLRREDPRPPPSRRRGRRGGRTFSYDTERGGEWTRRGGWRLPFKGQAHYDRHLDAWVGIGASSSGAGGHPRLVACDVVHLSDAADDPSPPPKWTACEETLTFLQGGALRERRVGGDPKLVPMGGGGGTFCVVESAPRAGLELIGLGSLLGDGDKFELRVTVFHAKYGENGELLMTTTASAAAAASHTYALSRYLSNFHAPAFWM